MAFHFDRFSFSRERGLFDAGEPVAIEPQAFELLAYLLEHRDRVVSREELNDQIWDGRVVSEAALSTQIRTVRRVLGDDRTQQKYIKTLPKRGFQFVGAVDVKDDAALTETARSGYRLRWMWTGLAVVIVLVLAGLVWIQRDSGDAKALPKLSIAVLPFDNLSGDPEQEYFADAITEDLITDLSRIRDAFVIARRTSFTYKGRATDISTVAEELGVRYVLEGSVQRSGNQVRINAQLIDGKTNQHVWSDRFDRELTDAFSVQQDVTGRIAAVLKAELREADRQRQGPAASLEAWDYALQGNVLLFNPSGPEDFKQAKVLLERALAVDADIASAWSGLAFVHFAASVSPIPGLSQPESKMLSLEAARNAVSRDPKNAEGHWMIGVGYARNGQPERGMASCDVAMDLNPNNDCAYVCAGLANMSLGRPTDALPHFEHSLRLNPRFRPFTKYKYMGLAYIQDGRDAEAIEVLNRAVNGSPKDPVANFALASALALDDRVADAEAALERFLDFTHGDISIEGLRRTHSWMGPDFERVLDGLRLAGLAER